MNFAISINFLLWFFLFGCPDPGWTTQTEETSLEVKIINIMDRMRRMEAEIIDKVAKELETRDQRIADLEAAMEAKDHKIAVLEASMITEDVLANVIETKDMQMGELEEEMKSLTGRMDVTEETDVLLRGMVDQVRNPPFAFQCAWQDEWTTDNSLITYDRLTCDEISGGSIYNVTGGLDINTGVFTVGQGFSGTWEISYTIKSSQYSGDNSQAWLYINGEQIAESYHGTSYTGTEGYVSSLGSRSLYMRLESGDTITLRTGLVRIFEDITLCVNLAQFDYVPPM